MADDTESIEGLRERLRRLEAMVDASGLGLWEWDVRTGALAWNARNRELLGARPDGDLSIQDFAELIHPDDLEAVRATYREAASQPEGGHMMFEFRTTAPAGGASRWLQQRGRVLRDGEGINLVVGATLDVTDRKTAEERRTLVLRELAHRAKNGIMVMMTLVAQTARTAADVREFEALLSARLQAMADSQDLVTQASGRPLRLGDLLDRALTPFDPARFDVGPGVRDIDVASDMALALALLMHELSTNAVKYGALSIAGGRVSLTRDTSPSGMAQLCWRERGGPQVTPPKRRGFGSRLLEVALRNSGGCAVTRYASEGLEADICFPLAQD